LNYNALDVFGSTIGFFASDSTFNTLDISSGPSETGFNIGNLLQVAPWNPNTAYVTWHSSGEDKAWFLSDGTTGWYRIGVTPSPEQGVTISPFATIVGGAQAVQSIETSPGVHQLLIGSPTSGPILARNLTQFQDNGNNYTWYATVGSIVLVNPGQLAEVAFITTEANAVGTPPSVGVILDEAFPTYTGPFENIADFRQRSADTAAIDFDLRPAMVLGRKTQQPAVCRHLQIQVTFPAEPAKNELWNFCVFWGHFTRELDAR
jgi:hypothetical protein